MSDTPIEKLKKIIARLRAPGGCPWDIKQTPQTITPHIIEEAYELVDAIESKNNERIIDELSDQLLHVVMISQILSESKAFTFDDVANHCAEKMIRRHPHVFGNKTAKTESDVNDHWETIKRIEHNGDTTSILENIPNHFPALLHAHKIQKKVANVGFDWPNVDGAKEKLVEECNEFLNANKTNEDEELGDILFSITNVCRKLGKSAEDLLQKANKKFKNRFKRLEQIANQHQQDLNNIPLETLEVFWDQAKKL